MLQIFRNTSPYTVILLLIITLLLKMQALLHPIAPIPVDGYYIYNHVLAFLNVAFNGNAFVYTLFAVFNVFFQSLYLTRIGSKHKLFSHAGYLPALSFLLFSSVYPPFNYFGIPLLLNWLLLGCINVVFGFGQTLQPRKHIFNAGFLLCLAALLQFSAVIYFLFLLACLIILRPFNISEWVVALMGYFTPVYFFACILFLAGSMSIIYNIPHLGISLPRQADWRTVILICGFIILFFSGVYAVQSQVVKMSVYVRRNWFAIVIYMFISLAVAIFTESIIPRAWLVVMPALALVISNAFLLEKSKWFSNFAFYFSLIFVIYCQWALK